MAIVKKIFMAKGMHCGSCERLIEKSVGKIDGVQSIKADYETERCNVVFDNSRTSIGKIFDAVENKGYSCSLIDGQDKPTTRGKDIKFTGIVFWIIGVIIAGYFILKVFSGIALPEISQNMGYGLLFIVGLLTGFHCVSMCGGFVVSYTAKHAQEGTSSYSSHFMYGLGKTISYTVIGAAFGLVGSIITFTPKMRGITGILAGIFLVIFGLNMLNVVPWLRKIRLHTPQFLARFVGYESKKHNSPLVIGLLNGLMIACGPLQAIYIMAAGTGSMIEGAKILFIFALGTLPVMLSFGFITSMISSKATHKILKASGVIVIILGLVMVNRGLALTGTGLDAPSLLNSISDSDMNTLQGSPVTVENGYQIIRMDVTRYGWEPNKFVLKKDVPVKWIINGKELNGCNNAIQVPKLGLNFDIKPGEQVIEFTPKDEGIISWSCWMGMIQGTFIVKSDIDLNNAREVQKQLDVVNVPKGKCGCGGARK